MGQLMCPVYICQYRCPVSAGAMQSSSGVQHKHATEPRLFGACRYMGMMRRF